jgi:hypothetical protein
MGVQCPPAFGVPRPGRHMCLLRVETPAFNLLVESHSYRKVTGTSKPRKPRQDRVPATTATTPIVPQNRLQNVPRPAKGPAGWLVSSPPLESESEQATPTLRRITGMKVGVAALPQRPPCPRSRATTCGVARHLRVSVSQLGKISGLNGWAFDSYYYAQYAVWGAETN